MGAKPPPRPVKSIDFRGFSGTTGAEPPHPWKDKKFKPLPGQIPEYAPGTVRRRIGLVGVGGRNLRKQWREGLK